jgi:hypothetical protein
VKKYFLPALLVSALALSSSVFALPEYAAFSGSNCMSCHTGPVGGFGRKPVSREDAGYITDKFYMSGDFLFMALFDKRDRKPDRFVLFPMEASLHFGFKPRPNLTIAASQDYGTLREAYAMLHNETETAYVRAGYFTLPYGLLFQDHTAFVKEGRVETGNNNFEERGVGAGLFSVRYKDSGIEGGLSGRPWFVNVAMTAGVVGQEDRAFPSSQGGTKRAKTVRGGILTKNICLGVSNYTNDSEILDRRILRYGVFGWVRAGSAAILFEHDEGEDEQFEVAGSTQSSASYVEAVYGFPFPGRKWPSFAKVRYERLDPNRSIESDVLQRIVGSYRFQPLDYLNIETFYRKNLEEPSELNNDDIYVLTHVFF